MASQRIRGFTYPQYDFASRGFPNRSYIVASSYRCGSTYLCRCLWRTGVMGAPWEYLNDDHHQMQFMWTRVGATKLSDYVHKLMSCRTSSNGVFGLKAHFHHFETATQNWTAMVETMQALGPLKFIYVTRDDVVAQAVSMAKAIQTNAWMSFLRPRRMPLFYDFEFINACMEEIERQNEGWRSWFSEHGVEPLRVRYEDLIAGESLIIDRVVRFLGAENDEAEHVDLPEVEPQSDATNSEWIRRFRAEASRRSQVSPHETEPGQRLEHLSVRSF